MLESLPNMNFRVELKNGLGLPLGLEAPVMTPNSVIFLFFSTTATPMLLPGCQFANQCITRYTEAADKSAGEAAASKSNHAAPV